MYWLTTTLAVARREFRDFQRNPALGVMGLALVLLAVGFIYLADRERGAQPIRLQVVGGGRLPQVLSLSGVFRVEHAAGVEAASRAVERGDADLGLVLPSTLDEDVRAGKRPTVDVLVAGDGGPAAAVGLAALMELLRVYAGQAAPVALQMKSVGSEARAVRKGRSVSIWMLMVLLTGFAIVATSLIEDRERGTWQAVLVTRARLAAVLLGKALAGWVLCVTLAGVILAAVGSLTLASLAVVAAGAAFAVGLGLWMGGVFPNMAAANAGLPFVFLLLFVPLALTRVADLAWLEAWTRFLPSHTLLQAMQGALEQGLAWHALPVSLIGMCAWALLFSQAAWLTLRAAQER
jgi:ABC-2 type transport system permease protein